MSRQISVLAKASRKDWSHTWPIQNILARNSGQDVETILANFGHREVSTGVTTVIIISSAGDIEGSQFRWSGALGCTIKIQEVFGSDAPPATLEIKIPEETVEFSCKSPHILLTSDWSKVLHPSIFQRVTNSRTLEASSIHGTTWSRPTSTRTLSPRPS